MKFEDVFFFFFLCVCCYLLLCLVAKRWVCLVGINSLLIDGGGGFDCENVKFACLLLFWVCFVGFDLLLINGGGGFDCENVNFAGYIDCKNVKFDSRFALVLGFRKNMKNKFLFSYQKIIKVKKKLKIMIIKLD